MEKLEGRSLYMTEPECCEVFPRSE